MTDLADAPVESLLDDLTHYACCQLPVGAECRSLCGMNTATMDGPDDDVDCIVCIDLNKQGYCNIQPGGYCCL